MPNRNKKKEPCRQPEILAPAGSKDALLAAIAAGADAVYCGHKQFSARMAADNFAVEELARYADLACAKGVRLYIAFNSLIKPDELDSAAGLLDQLNRYVQPAAIIFQDLAMVSIARQVGYAGELHLSTLANVSFPSALRVIRQLQGVRRVVIPRELHVDEIRAMAAACPTGMDLEVFVHGALCYAVSGRCYWSSYMGGKSGLRGHCVQPCRRVYQQAGQKKRLFSCNDLSLDVLAKVLLSERKISAWKIEGRKKGAHYVYQTVMAYRRFRDHAGEPDVKKEALFLLESALGRKGCHYHFLPQRPYNPIDLDTQTGSGLLVGNVKGPRKETYLVPNTELFAGDLLRIGYEDEPWHQVYRVTKSLPKRGKLVFHTGPAQKKGTPVFLLDRRDDELTGHLRSLEQELEVIEYPVVKTAPIVPLRKRHPKQRSKRKRIIQDIRVERNSRKGRMGPADGFWLSPEVTRLPRQALAGSWCWLPPVIWPEEAPAVSDLIQQTLRKGCTRFVLNAPWQIGLLPSAGNRTIWAGPFCNITNRGSVQQMADLGFAGVIVSPELGRQDYFDLARKSVLPIGLVIRGNWPLCVSRIISREIRERTAFVSPKGEEAWAVQHGSLYWLFPNWELDLRPHRKVLEQAGYTVFVTLSEPVPRQVSLKKRTGFWNWRIGLMALSLILHVGQVLCS